MFGVGVFLLQATPSGGYSLPPETPNTGVETLTSITPDEKVRWGGREPQWLSIPAVGIETGIELVAENEKGEMAVPDGSSDMVGWYRHGTVPGETGSAVLAAHVYAGFKKLRGVEPGERIEVTGANGVVRRFVVEEVKLTPLAEVSPYFLFERADAARLNLITCAGKFDKKLGTYTHRLIVYAVLES